MNSSPILVASHLNRTVPGPDGPLTLLEDINLQVAAGEAVAIIGPSGSGKSTLLGLLAGLDVPSGGEVTLDGKPFSGLSEDARARRRGERCAFVFQSFHLVADLTAEENVMLPLELRGDSQARDKARQWLEQVGLSHRLHHFPAQLSGGEQQRVALARAFAVTPALLFADEPTGSLDHANGERISDLLFSMNEASDTALVLVTHDDTLANRCQRQLRLDAGKLHD